MLENLTCIFAAFFPVLLTGVWRYRGVLHCAGCLELRCPSRVKGAELPRLLLMALSSAVFRGAGAAPDTHAQPVLSLSSLTAHVSSAGVF